MLKDIVERPSSTSASAPLPQQQPQPRKSTGFPVAVHRSQRGPSAFARARQQQAARQNGDSLELPSQRVVAEGKAVDAVPSISLSTPPSALPSLSAQSSTATPEQGDGSKFSSEAEEVRRAVEADNLRRVEGMTPAEREDEILELEERFGSNIMSFMRKRQQARLSATTSTSAPAESMTAYNSMSADNVNNLSAEAGPSYRSDASPPPSSTQTVEQALGDAQSILRDVDQENRQRVEGMDGLEREQEVEELQERFGTKLMDALRKRAEKRGDKGKEKERADEPAERSPERNGRLIPQASSSTAANAVAIGPKITRSSSKPRSHPEDPSLSDLKAYFPAVPSETSKLAWLRPLTPSQAASQSSATRFDLSGSVLTSTAQANLPSHLGLHHHGTSPDLAGYTISDILHLCRSTVPSQRITMMGVLSKVLAKHRDGQMSKEEGNEIEEAEARKRAVEMGVEVLAGLTRGVGVIEAGIEMLYEALAGPTWTLSFDDDRTFETPQGFRLDEDQDVGITSIPFEDVMPRVTELLSLDDGISPRTVHQLISILQRATLSSPALCETICAAVPTTVKQHVIQRSWPPKSSQMIEENQLGSERSRYPSLDALRLLRDITISSRACAEELLGQGVYETMLRFVVTATWETSEDADMSIICHGQALACVVLDTYAVLGQYGLSASIATASSEIWRLLSTWVQRQSFNGHKNKSTTATGAIMVKRLVRAYFGCLGVWVTCAVDPHRTTPEHDLTWAQVDAMKWQEEAVEFIRNITSNALSPGSREGDGLLIDVEEITAAVDMLVLWANGVTVNGVKNGEQEKTAVLDGLKDSKLSGLVAKVLHEEKGMDEKLERLLAACVGLHDLLKPAGQLLQQDVMDTLRQRYLTYPWDERSPGAYSSRAVTHIRYHLVQLDIRAGPLSSQTSSGVMATATAGASWLPFAFSLFRLFTVGDEPLALDLLDAVLKSDYQSLIQAFTSCTLLHSDGLQLLRPLLQYAILPNVEHIVAPYQPSHLYLKATSTLRSSPPRVNDEKPALPGLPLQADWIFSPLDELLRSGTSAALAQVPPDWQASEVEIVQATLILAVLAYNTPRSGAISISSGLSTTPSSASDGARSGLSNADRSRIILNLMKVHMLEHGQTTSNTANEVEVFRDPLVGDIMKQMMAWVTRPSSLTGDGSSTSALTATVTTGQKTDDGEDYRLMPEAEDEAAVRGSITPSAIPTATTNATTTATAPLEKIAIPFLGTGVPFYQFYADFVALYEAISFSDPLFSQLLLAPLSMGYPADYRRLVWNDHSSVLRGISLNHVPSLNNSSSSSSGSEVEKDERAKNQIPIENGQIGVRAYFKPLETDPQVLSAYARALAQGLVCEQRNPFLYAIAVHHLAGYLWDEDGEEERDSTRVGLLVGILAGAGNDELINKLLEWDLDSHNKNQNMGSSIQTGGTEGGIGGGGQPQARKDERKAMVGRLAGPRGTKRVEHL
ncbi:hypothetical protein I316_05855 [Kwoniella heveanensis BCC8398]|uniref:RNA polymerase II-associated protein 1 C-terminal domain-containing protein n=1 Tax=Kwoniella heveanensis BCC8398 TaxID=1296120 RepID=A0A1B9GMW5_9TREE|nr:hypothetical protein I316_05855 [Kwoniella heveanensis BCC8398]